MKVHLVTFWDVDPDLWATAHGCDPSTCARHLLGDLTAAIADLPIYREHSDLTPREADPSGVYPDQLDGRTRFWCSWTIETSAQRWREGRASYDTFANVPELHRARDDLALVTARELFEHAEVWEADVVMNVTKPFTARWTREDLFSRPFVTPAHTVNPGTARRRPPSSND